MTKTYKEGFRVGFANFFGVTGYVLIAFQWGLLVLVYFKWLYEVLLKPMQVQHPVEVPVPIPPPAANGEPNTIVFIFGIIITIVMIALTVYAIIKAPSMIAGTGKKVVRAAAKQTTTIVLRAQHKKDTPRNRLKLTPRFIFIFKLTLVLLPLGFAWGSQSLPEKDLSYELTILLSVWMAAISILLFSVQYVLAIVLKVDRNVLR